jgi:hypothetical protein
VPGPCGSTRSATRPAHTTDNAELRCTLAACPGRRTRQRDQLASRPSPDRDTPASSLGVRSRPRLVACKAPTSGVGSVVDTKAGCPTRQHMGGAHGVSPRRNRPVPVSPGVGHAPPDLEKLGRRPE